MENTGNTKHKAEAAQSRGTTHTKRTYTPAEVAQMVGLSRNTTYGLLQLGVIRSIRVGRLFIIPSDALDDFLGGAK
jgi:excisionase family DNA binding protein